MAEDIDNQIAFVGDLDDDHLRIARNCINLRKQNAKIISDIEKMGGDVDVVVARLEHVLESLVELGIITADNLWSIQYSWEQSLRIQLTPIRDRLKDVATTPRPANRQQRRLWTPGKN